MEYKKAYELVKNLLNAVDKHSEQMLTHFHHEGILEKVSHEHIKSLEDLKNNFHNSTAISQDDKWELECLEPAIDILWALVRSDL